MKVGILLVVGLTLAPTLVQGDPRDDAIDTMMKCASIADKAARSDCFDAAIPQLRAAAQMPPPSASVPPAQVASAPPAPAATAMQDRSIFDTLNPFGGVGEAKASPQQMAYQPVGAEIVPLTIGVAAFGISPGGGFEVTLENGQVWQEHARDYDIPPFRSDRRNVVTIDRALLGGYNLSLIGYGKLYKVVRVK